MTLPFERTLAIGNTRRFLARLMDPQEYPGIPRDVRREARSLLKHYPNEHEMERQVAGEQIFGTWQSAQK